MDRRVVERRLDTLIRNNRVTIAITFPLVGTVLLVAAAEGHLPERVAFHPFLLVGAVLVMALPLIGGLAPIVDRRVATGLLGLVAFTYSIELLGVYTGFPYGDFEYLRALGPMLFDAVPVALPVFYLPILLNSYLLCALMLGDRMRSLPVRFLSVLAVVVTMDLVLDPGAVALGFWGWDAGGVYYDVPIQNYVGWVVSGTVAVAILTVTFDHAALTARLDRCEFLLDDLISFGVFWGIVNLYFGNPVPVALAAALLVALFRADWFDFAGLARAPSHVPTEK